MPRLDSAGGNLENSLISQIWSLSLFTQPCRLAATAEVGEMHWKFYFKLYCFLDTENVPKDSVEFAFMFEQVKDKGSVLRHFEEEEKKQEI